MRESEAMICGYESHSSQAKFRLAYCGRVCPGRAVQVAEQDVKACECKAQRVHRTPWGSVELYCEV